MEDYYCYFCVCHNFCFNIVVVAREITVVVSRVMSAFVRIGHIDVITSVFHVAV